MKWFLFIWQIYHNKKNLSNGYLIANVLNQTLKMAAAFDDLISFDDNSTENIGMYSWLKF